MQPLPSGLPPTIPLPPLPPQNSTPPPPPPPPPLPIAAFTSAAAKASLYPPSRRRPTLHILVVLGSATVPVLRHAHHALCTLSAKGVHVFLQTETERIGARTVTPITSDVVPDVVAACRADFIVLIADRNVPSRTVQARLSPTAEFVDVPLSDLPDAVLSAWSQQLRAMPDRLQRISLAFNPNVVTATHLDLLLQCYSGVSSIRRSYARLARLVNITQTWEHLHSISGGDSAETESWVGRKLAAAKESEPAVDPGSSEKPPQSANSPVETSPDLLALKALRDGVRRIARAQSGQQGPGSVQAPKSDVNYSWLKRSEHMSARLLRSQLLATDLHRKLVESFDIISKLPLAPSSLAPFNGVHLPTEAHRQRLLREINDILPRIEELGQRLSKRPRTQRRRRQFHGANPWMSYLSEARVQTEKRGIATRTGTHSLDSQMSFWRCFACRTFNEPQLPGCKVCQTGSPVLSTNLKLGSSDVLGKRFRESLKNSNGTPSPWIFAPGAIPIQPPVSSALNGIVRREHVKPDSQANSFIGEDAIRPDPTEIPFGSPPLREVSKTSYPQYEISSAMQALSFDDEYNGFTPETKKASKRVADHRNAYRQSPSRSHQPHSSQSTSGSKTNISPVRLSSSAPNGPAPVEFTPERLANGSRHTTSPALPTNKDNTAHPPQNMKSPNGHEGTQRGSSSMLAGSFPGVSIFSSNLAYDSGTLSQQDVSKPVDRVQQNIASAGGVAIDHTVSPAKSGLNSAMEELALGSYEAIEPRHRLAGSNRRPASNPIAIPGSASGEEAPKSGITSLEALAAASDAANGGIGSATQESLRAVNAVVTPNRNQSSKQSEAKNVPNGTYNMF